MASDNSPFRSLGILAARLADGKKATDINLRHVGEMSPLADYVMLATVESRAQMEAVQESIRLDFKELEYHMIHRDGLDSDHWRVLDYGGLLIHLMQPKARDFYALDKLFNEGRRVPWEPRESPAPAEAPAKRASAPKKKTPAPKKKTAAPKKKTAAKKK
jgi:ribosome-associated protein